MPRANGYRRSGPGVAGHPCTSETQRDASEAPDLDSPTTREPRRHVLEHHVHRERDVALDKVGLLVRDSFDELRLRHCSIVAPSMLARLSPAGCGYSSAIARAMAAPTRSAAASISLSARWA